MYQLRPYWLWDHLIIKEWCVELSNLALISSNKGLSVGPNQPQNSHTLIFFISNELSIWNYGVKLQYSFEMRHTNFFSSMNFQLFDTQFYFLF